MQPVMLPECGHIFCRTCITSWFDSGQKNANTCPLDRRELFGADTGQSAEERDAGAVRGTDALVATPVAARRAGSSAVEVMIHRGWVIARDGRLTWAGCRLVIYDLWRCTAGFRSWLAIRLDELLGLDIEELRLCILAAIPTGVRCEDREWAVLYQVARQMLAWHHERVRVGVVLAEVLMAMVHSLHEAGNQGN